MLIRKGEGISLCYSRGLLIQRVGGDPWLIDGSIAI